MATYTIKRRDGIGEELVCEADDLLAVCDSLSEGGKHPLDIAADASADFITRVDAKLEAQSVAAGLSTPTPSPANDQKPNSTWEKQVSDDVARVRIEGLQKDLIRAGVNVDAGQQAYATGTRMADVGYSTQEGRKAEFQKKLSIGLACSELSKAVRSEGREDRVVTASEIGKSIKVNGSISILGGFALSEQAIRGLAGRIDSPMAGYVFGLRDRIAERHASGADSDKIRYFNQQDKAEIASVIQHECRQAGDKQVKLRLRSSGRGGKPDCYAVVGLGYSPADAPEALAQIGEALPSDAKGSYFYDPESTGWELRAEVWTPTPVAEQAVGEPFRGYAVFRGKDNGTGKLRGGGGAELLRCLNASTYLAEGSEIARVHRGRVLWDIDKMAREALAAIDALCKAWGVNRSVEIPLPEKVTIGQAIPGFWSYLLKDRRSSLVGVLPGRSAAHVEGLTRAFFEERRDNEKLVRSDFAQGWTRYIQDRPSDVRRDAEAAIGEWLVDSKPVDCDLDYLRSSVSTNAMAIGAGFGEV